MKQLIIYYFFFLFFLFSFFSSGVIDSQDGFQYLAVARNIYYTGKPTAPPYEYDKRQNIHMSVIIGKDGNTYSLTGLGYSLAYLPAVAITDMVYKIYHISPAAHFPLENDWLIFLTASFTNSFFGAILGVTLFLYLLELGLSKKQAIFISLLGLLTTNLLVYTKHSFPHMMHVTFLLLSFYLVKIYFKKKKIIFLILSGSSFGITSIIYIHTILLALPSIFIYMFMISNVRLNMNSLKVLFIRYTLFLIGMFPFLLIHFWFENLRVTQGGINFSSPSTASASILWLLKVPIGVLIEGLHGQLFSPGRSIFLYSPILLLIILFWFKIKKRIFPELIAFIILSVSYIVFYASVYRVGGLDQGIAPLWHGENSWGPRYLTPLIPLGLLIIGHIYQSFSKKIRLFVFYPLVIVGLYIQLLGVLIPYQTKLFNLQEKFFLNGTEYPAVSYSNFLPRYTPLLTMSRNFIKLIQNFPKTFNHGIHKVRFFDGIDFPFNVGSERWRSVEGQGIILFDNLNKNPIKKFNFGMINHSLSESSVSAKLTFSLNGQLLTKEEIKLKVGERSIFSLPVDSKLVKNKDNKLTISVDYEDQDKLKKGKQILGLIAFSINDISVNLESLDIPYVSSLGPILTGKKYENWGGSNKDPWKFWDIHTQTFERIPDLWWIRNLYYWDIPKNLILSLLTLNIVGLIIMSIKLKEKLK